MCDVRPNTLLPDFKWWNHIVAKQRNAGNGITLRCVAESRVSGRRKTSVNGGALLNPSEGHTIDDNTHWSRLEYGISSARLLHGLSSNAILSVVVIL